MTTARLPSLRLLFGDLLKDDFSLRFDRMTLPLSLSLSLSVGRFGQPEQALAA
jgi:hypothetical protein